MKKNVASQKIGAQMCSATDGSAFTGAVTVYVTGDAGTQAAGSVGAGACTHEGNGYHTYAPAQAETNYDLVAFTFIGTGAIPSTVQVYTSFPQTGDAYAEATNGTYGLSAIETLVDGIETTLGTPAGASVSADVAAVKAETASILTDTAEIGLAGAGLTALATQASVNTIDDFLDTEVAAILAAVDTEVAAIKAKTDNLPAAPAATGDIPTAAAVADAVWDETLSGHLTAGSTGEALNAAGAAGDPWTTSLPGAYGAGSAGYIIGNNIDAAVSSRASQTSVNTIDDFLDTEMAAVLAAVDTEVAAIVTTLGTPAGVSVSADIAAMKVDTAAILVDTAEIGAAGAGLTNINLPDQTMNITGNITGNLSGSVGSLATQAKADVNAEVVDALNVDTYAEPGQGAPAATLSLAAKINYLFKTWRNKKTQTATTFSLYDDAGTTVDQKSTVSDDGTTTTRGEIATGP